ncbi:hypothetical protein AB0H12_17670 [Actinosynnema sp. NPDC023794]
MAVVTVLVRALGSPNGLQSAASVGSLVAALTPLVLGLVLWARRPPLVTLTTSTVEQTDAAQRQLAGQVLGQWRDEVDVRQLDDPGPLAVRWRFTELDVADHVARESRLRVLLGRGRHRFTGRTDRIGDIAARFRGLERRRLVILGEPGTGKTTLALLLLRELLDHAEPGEPVPVLVPLSEWDPGAETLHEWLTRRLAEDYPALRATAFGPDAARSLVTGRRVLPVLDGLDELPEGVRPAVLLRLNEVAADPLVLTCRTAEYQAAVTAPGGDALTGGAVIEPDPLTPADAADYLAGCLPPGAAGDWRGLLATLAGDRRGPVTEALSTPLALWLLRKVYVDTGTHPAELCDRSRFPSADAVVEHLLDHLVAALISVNPPRDGEHVFRPRRAWEPTDATRWLTFLAHHLTTIGSRDFAWWRLHRAARRRVAVAAGLIAGVVLGMAVAVGEGLLVGPVNGVLLGPLVGLAFGLVVGFARGLTIGHVAGLVFGFSLLGAGVGAGLVGGEPVVGLVFLVAGGIPVVIVGVLAARAVGFTPPKTPVYADLRLRGRTRLLVRELTKWAGGGLVLRFVPGFSAGLVFGGVLGAAGETSDGLRSALVFGLVLGGATWLAVGLVDWAETPQADDRPQTPVTAFRRDVRLVCLKSVVGGSVIGLAFWLQDVLSGTGGSPAGLVVGVLVTLAIALGVGAHQPSGRYLVAVLALRAGRQVPRRLLGFLDDAHRLGIVRRTGPVYQFRHARLQDHLTGKSLR